MARVVGTMAVAGGLAAAAGSARDPKSGSRAARLMAELPDNVRDGENGDGCSPSPGG